MYVISPQFTWMSYLLIIYEMMFIISRKCVFQKNLIYVLFKEHLLERAPEDWLCITKKVQVVSNAILLEYKRSVNFGT